MSKEQAVYSHGHHASVLQSHTWRTAQNSAAFILPYIRQDSTILDIGCGPGTITVDLAKLVPKGKVIGIDAASDVIEKARTHATEQGATNVTFETADANSLQYRDASFDLVFAHQTLQHVKDPVGVLKEMRRVAKPGAIVAARDADYKSFAWYPQGLEKWGALYQSVAKANGGEPNAGRYLHVWAKQAGFKANEIESFWTAWCYGTHAEAKWWSDSWADRAIHSSFATTATSLGLATKEDLEELSATWKKWGEHDDAFFTIPSGELLCHMPTAS